MSTKHPAWLERAHALHDSAENSIRMVAAVDPDRAAKDRETAEAARRTTVANNFSARNLPRDALLLETFKQLPANDIPETPALAAYKRAIAWREQWCQLHASQGESAVRIGTGMMFVACGTYGIGKTFALATCVLHHKSFAWFELSSTIAGTAPNGWSENEARWRQWEAVDLLAIDEVGDEIAGNPQLVGALVTRRFNEGRGTILATNLSPRQFAERIGIDGRLQDRLVNGQGHAGAPTGQPWQLVIDGETLRTPAARAALLGKVGT